MNSEKHTSIYYALASLVIILMIVFSFLELKIESKFFYAIIKQTLSTLSIVVFFWRRKYFDMFVLIIGIYLTLAGMLALFGALILIIYGETDKVNFQVMVIGILNFMAGLYLAFMNPYFEETNG